MKEKNIELGCFFPPYNRRTCCPPGRLRPQQENYRPNIIVASFPRSGTHLLIDLILNNFKPYRRSPLIVDVDHFINDKDRVMRVLECGGYVLKTHFPVNPDVVLSASAQDNMKLLIERAIIFRPIRDKHSVLKSAGKMWPSLKETEILGLMDSFQLFWESHNTIDFKFIDITGNYSSVVARISRYLGIPAPKRITGPYSKDRVYFILLTKLLTRVLGRFSPLINTTIGFGK